MSSEQGSRRSRLGQRLGPEGLAALLTVIALVLVAALVVALVAVGS